MASSIPPRAPRRLQALALVGLSLAAVAALAGAAAAQEPAHSAELDAAIVRAAKRHGVPEHLVRRIVMRESRYNPRARNHSFWGLMQISYPTARSMGFKGTPEQLLNPVTNLAYAVPYLANAFVAAGRQEDAAVRLYASGYYTTARSRGILGLLRTADSKPLNGVPDEPTLVSTPPAAVADSGWSLFGSGAPAGAPVAQQQLAYAAPESAAAAPAQAQIRAIARAAPARAETRGRGKTADKNADDGVAMVAGRDGAMAPPRRWQHDGGTSVIARGEQGVEHIAAYRLADDAASRARRSRKTTVFASLDAPGVATAAASPQPAAFYATAAAPAAADASQDPQQAAAQLAANEAVGALAVAPVADGDSADKPRHRHRRHHESDDE